ncbi:SpoVR family protein [Gracilibacillus boraciitolerans]|uniref:SpoVR family protein n=1 Tax=Gracilibacillus boraciitolerans TaxID=307521 RepID=UPI00055848E3|nr:SpoVR family protein [Gracilibacillus boraciitolerans]
MKTDEKAKLERSIQEITEIAEGFGLDFYPMRYEICPPEILYTFGAYGMPTRFSHWSFGKQFHRMKLQYDLGLSKIYELVINSNPCYAFLLHSNSLIQNKLIVAHVLAHCDFFKNNVRFQNTKRDMVESMSATAERVAIYEKKYGIKEVEKFLDAVLAIQEHIDPTLLKAQLDWQKDDEEEPAQKKRTAYDDLWDLDDANKNQQTVPSKRKRSFPPPHPEKDILLFIEEHSRELEDWQRDILTMMREEMLYFWPQLETKIMNEGWATFWHQRILRELELTSDETIEFASLNASVVQPSKTQVNPYYLGVKMFEDIEERYNHPSEEMNQFGGVKEGTGREKIFEVREIESDISFMRNYLTKELVAREDLYLFQKQGHQYKIVDKKWEEVRDQLILNRLNGGFPYLTVDNGDYLRNGELYICHHYEGVELDVKYLEKTLPYIFTLWGGRDVHIETVMEEKSCLFSCNGIKVVKKFM